MSDEQEQVQLDLSVEPLVRKAIAAAAGRSIDHSIAALTAMEGQARECMYLATMICMYLLHDLDPEPDEEYVQELATTFSEMETWGSFDSAEVALLIKGIVGLPRTGNVEPDSAMRIVFALDAWLLSGIDWGAESVWQKLDSVVHRIEADSRATPG